MSTRTARRALATLAVAAALPAVALATYHPHSTAVEYGLLGDVGLVQNGLTGGSFSLAAAAPANRVVADSGVYLYDSEGINGGGAPHAIVGGGDNSVVGGGSDSISGVGSDSISGVGSDSISGVGNDSVNGGGHK